MRTRSGRRGRGENPFHAEAELVDVLRDVASSLGWACYPETSGWDLLLVLESGEQAGVQAKIRSSVDVLDQALPSPSSLRGAGPDVHLAAVPRPSPSFARVAQALGVGVVHGCCLAEPRRREEHLLHAVAAAPRQAHRRRCWLPPFVPRGKGGVPSPSPVTPWKVAAVQLCARARQREVTRDDFQELGLTPAWWLRAGVLLRVDGRGVKARYAPAPGVPLPDERWPEVVDGLRSAGVLPG